ncbi:hypothetical protein KI387_031781, partial [Taxus chinensis]
TDDVGIPILGVIDEDMTDVEELAEVRGEKDIDSATNAKGTIDAKGMKDIEGVVGDIDVEVGNTEVTFMDIARGIE